MTLYSVQTRLALLLVLGMWPLLAGAAEPPAHTDAFGDPLPTAAIRRIGSVRFRQGGAISVLLPCPDGKTLLSSSTNGDRAVCLWDLATGRLRRRFPGSWDRRPIALSPKGTVLSTTENGTIHLWDFASGRELRRLKGHRNGTVGLAFSPDGKLLASAGRDGVCLWNTATGAEVGRIAERLIVYGLILTFTPDGKTLVAGPAVVSKKVYLWDVVSRRKLRELTPTDGMQPRSLALSPDGTLLAAGSPSKAGDSDGIIPLWDVTTGKVVRQLRCGSGRIVTKVVFSPDGKLLAAVHGDIGKGSTVQVWVLATGKPRCSFPAYASSMAFAREGKTLFTADYVIRRWDVNTGKEIGSQAEPHYPSKSVALSPDGRLLASVSGLKVYLRDAATGRTCHRFAPAGEQLSACAFAPDGKTLATATFQGVVRLWNITDPGKVHRLREIIVGKPQVNIPKLGLKGDRLVAVAFAPHGEALATSSRDGTVCLVDPRTGAVRWRIRQDEPSIESLGFTADGRRLFTATQTREGTLVGAWDVARGGELGSLTATINLRLARTVVGRTYFPYRARLALSPDGRMLALNRAETISVWEAASGKERLRLRGHTEIVQAVAFSPDARVLASAAWDDTIRLWDLATGTELTQLRGHQGNARSLCFSPDGKLLYSAGDDTTILVWDVAQALRRGLPGVPRRDAQAAWKDLAAADTGLAYRSMHALRADPAAALALFRKQLRPAASVEGKRVAQWLRDLDATRFDVRDKAARELARWDEQAEPALRRALADKPSLEVRRRLEELLEKLAVPSGERLRPLRALEVLEAIGTAEAREALETLANGAPKARLSREAKGVLARLAKRSGHRP